MIMNRWCTINGVVAGHPGYEAMTASAWNRRLRPAQGEGILSRARVNPDIRLEAIGRTCASIVGAIDFLPEAGTC